MAEAPDANSIENALLQMSARDQDYAAYENGVGFNGRDTAFGNSLADQVRAGKTLSPKQRAAAYRMLRTYKVQLLGYGVDYASIPAPDVPDNTAPQTSVTGTLKLAGQGYADFTTTGYSGEFYNLCKQVPGGKWDKIRKSWRFPMSAAAINVMAEVFEHPRVTIERPVLERAEQVLGEAERTRGAATSADVVFEVDDNAARGLRPFQRAGVGYLAHVKQALLGDEMGLGKTVQALRTLEVLSAFPAVVVVPAVVKLNWQREVRKWLHPDLEVAVLSGRLKDPEGMPLPTADILIINYDILTSWLPLLLRLKPKAVIADESHYAKNSKSKRTKALLALGKVAEVKLALSGTMVLNRPIELVPQLTFLGKLEAFGGFRHFAQRYCAPRPGWGGGTDYSGASNTLELHEMLKATCYLRRVKSDVMAELPAKARTIVPMELANRPRYEETKRSLRRWYEERIRANVDIMAEIAELGVDVDETVAAMAAAKGGSGAQAMVQLEALKQVVAEEKLENVKSWINEFLEGTDKKLVVFANHREIVKALADHYGAPRIDGGIGMDKRQEYVDAFQEDPMVRLIICNIAAGGVGITLTAASDVAFVELPWRPADLDQAEDRCHRIGQEDSVTCWYLLAERTVEEDISAVLDAKRGITEAVIDGKEVASISLVSALMRKIMEEE